MTIRHLYIVAAAVALACAPAGGTSGNAGAPQRNMLLTAEELGRFDSEGKTTYDMVSRLRPAWLRMRGVPPMVGASDSSEFALVMVDGLAMGRIQALRDIQPHQVSEIHYYDPSVASGQFGERGSSGVIAVIMKTPR